MKKILMFLGVLAAMEAGAQSIISNGDFSDDNYAFCHQAPKAWTTSTGGMQLDQSFNGGDWWIDMTDCDWGNNRWIEQTVTTIPNRYYQLSFNLGCWADDRYTTGGVDLYVDGIYINHYNYEDFTGSYLKWKTFTVCVTTTSSSTTVRFVCRGEATANTPGWVDLNSSTSGNRVVGLDKVEMVLGTNPIFGAELIANGNFNDPIYVYPCGIVPPAWTNAGSSIGVQWVNDYTGTWTDLTDCNTGNGKGIEQMIPTIPGEVYRLSYKIGADHTGNASAQVSFNNMPVAISQASASTTQNPNWVSFTHDFRAITNWTSVKFLSASINPAVYIVGLDNVSVKQIICAGQEPAAKQPQDVTEQGAEMTHDVRVVPNPVEPGASTVQLNVNAPAGQLEVLIADYMGRQYVNQHFDIRDGGAQTLSVELGKANLAPGLYLLKVNGLDKPASQVLIVK